jgi:hypothetical protein
MIIAHCYPLPLYLLLLGALLPLLLLFSFVIVIIVGYAVVDYLW